MKEGSLEQLRVVLDSLQDQVSLSDLALGKLLTFMQVDAQLSEQVELVRLVDSDGLTLLHWAADRGQVSKCSDQSKLISFQITHKKHLLVKEIYNCT